jgi:hypothetical protein
VCSLSTIADVGRFTGTAIADERPDPTKLADPTHAALLALHSIVGRIQTLGA